MTTITKDQIHLIDGEIKKCLRCDEEKPIKKFLPRRSKLGGRYDVCRQCKEQDIKPILSVDFILGEDWIGVIGFEEMYDISSFGRIKTKNRKLKKGFKKEGLLRTQTNAYGYPCVKLSKDGKDYNYTIHFLVAKHFNENPNDYTEVNHLDGNKLNNKKENLAWCTRRENIVHAFENGLNRGRYKNSEKYKPLPITINNNEVTVNWE